MEFFKTVQQQKVSLAAALEICEVGEEATTDDLLAYSEYLTSREIPAFAKCPQSVLNFLNTTQVGGHLAEFIQAYPILGIFTGTICLILGIGFPFKLFQIYFLNAFSKSSNIYVLIFFLVARFSISYLIYAIIGIFIIPIIIIEFIIGVFKLPKDIINFHQEA